MDQNRTILVTGAAGMTGFSLMEQLLASGFMGQVRAVVEADDVEGRQRLQGLSEEIELVSGDLKDAGFVKEAVADVSEVIHIASIYLSPLLTDVAKASGVERIVYVHTTGIFSKYQSASANYRRIEAAIVDSGMDYIILRPTMIYGCVADRNIHKLIRYIKRHRFFPVFGRGKNLMQPIFYEDLAKGILRAWQAPRDVTRRKEYNLCGKDAVTYETMLRNIAELLGKKLVLVRVPFYFAVAAAWLMNLVWKKAPVSVEQVLRMGEDKAYPYEDAVRDLGFAPRDFADGVALQIAKEDY